MTHLYTLYTEDVHRSAIESALRNHFDGFTISPAIGYWQGDREDSLRIEIALPESSHLPYVAAREIAEANHQNSVLVTHSLIDSELVTAFGPVELNSDTELTAA